MITQHADTWCLHPVCERCLSQYEQDAHDAARSEYELKLEAIREMAAAKRLTYWKSHEQASSDYWRNMFGLMAEAWGEIARELETMTRVTEEAPVPPHPTGTR